MELFHPNLYDSNYGNNDDIYKQKAIALSGQKMMIPSTDPMLEVINSMQGKEVNTKSAIPDIFEYMNRFNGKKDSKKDDKKINENSVLEQQQQQQQQQLDEARRSAEIRSAENPTYDTSISTDISDIKYSEYELLPINININPKLEEKAKNLKINIKKIYVMIFIIEKKKTIDEFNILCIDNGIFVGNRENSIVNVVDMLQKISETNYENFFKFKNVSLTFTEHNDSKCYFYSYETDDLTTIVKTIGTKKITLKSYNDIITNPSSNSLNTDVQPFFDHFVRFHVPEELLDH